MDQASDPSASSLRDRVTSVIDQLRPAVQGDGGDLEFVDVDEHGVVQVRLHGACIGCPSAAMTLKFGVERSLKQRVPEVTQVVCV
ncbi:MAG: NifU family protein [Planctomycetes bacterium]|nr:NifU family protein [Planctomycetota bacterium]